MRDLTGAWVRPAARPQSLTGDGAFIFLNQPGTLSGSWEPAGKEKLWLYNLHYFDDLNAADAEQRRCLHQRLIDDWIARVPAGSGTGWEPYPVSLRIVNWIKWALSGNPIRDDAVQSLAVQSRWLARRIEWHILGNHLFSNAKALIFAGTFFSGAEADQWLRTGLNILCAELDEQILEDGGHFERSPMYHAVALEDVLDLVNLLRCAGGKLGSEAEQMLPRLEAKAAPMLRWLGAMCHPDGEISFFNDAAFGIAPPPAELTRYASSLGFQAPAAEGPIFAMVDTGYARMAASNAVLIADVGPVGPDYLPGHAHADTLSFELSLHGRRLIVNSGTSVYGNSQERLRQRGTAAHSTLVLDGRDSSEVWGGFRVGRRARPFGVAHRSGPAGLHLEASHDGYRWLPGKPVHSRSWLLGDASLTVTDSVAGEGVHSIDIYFHLPPSVAAEPIDPNAVRLRDIAEGKDLAEVRSESGLPILIEPGSWHPEFGLSLPSSRLRLETSGLLPLSHVLTVRWDRQ